MFQLFPFRGIILRDKNRVRRHRTPKGLSLEGNDFQRVFKGHAVQFDTHLARRVIGIEKHVDTGQLADRLVDHIGFFRDLERNRDVRDGSQFHRALRRFQPFAQRGRTRRGSLRLWILLLFNHLQRTLQFLLRDE